MTGGFLGPLFEYGLGRAVVGVGVEVQYETWGEYDELMDIESGEMLGSGDMEEACEQGSGDWTEEEEELIEAGAGCRAHECEERVKLRKQAALVRAERQRDERAAKVRRTNEARRLPACLLVLKIVG